MSNENKRSRIRVWFFIVFINVVGAMAMLFIIDTPQLKSGIEIEMEEAELRLPDNDWANIQHHAFLRYDRWFVESGIEDVLTMMFIPKPTTSAIQLNRMIPKKYNYRFVNNIKYTFLQAAYRIEMLQYWVWLMLPVIIALVLTGYYRWKMKAFTLKGGSTIVTKLVLRSFFFSTLLIVVFTVTPNFLTTYSFYIPPIMLLLMAWAISHVISAFHKDFG